MANASTASLSSATASLVIRPSLQQELQQVTISCNSCGLCVTECRFLQKYGSPRQIAGLYASGDYQQLVLSFECSLCRLCTVVCPEQVDPAAMFLEMRRESVTTGHGSFRQHAGLLSYEKRGTSRRYTWYALPEGCDTIFFPGCALPGSRPHRVVQLLEMMRRINPALGIVLDCCSKPSHDLGRERHFHAMFGELRAYLLGHGVRKVIVACPNCHKVFSDYGQALEVISIYEVLVSQEMAPVDALAGRVTIHDPCATRLSGSVQQAARELLNRLGLAFEELPHARHTTLCCGEGGAVGARAHGLARNWGKAIVAEAAGRRIVTYCAGCAHVLGRHTPTSHLIDLILQPAAALAGKVKVASAPFTYLNRLLLKRRLKKLVTAAVTRERQFIVEQ